MYHEDASHTACPICGKFAGRGLSMVAAPGVKQHRCDEITLARIDAAMKGDPDDHEARTPTEGRRLYDGFATLELCEKNDKGDRFTVLGVEYEIEDQD